jgi:hypothetical protein
MLTRERFSMLSEFGVEVRWQSVVPCVALSAIHTHDDGFVG